MEACIIMHHEPDTQLRKYHLSRLDVKKKIHHLFRFQTPFLSKIHSFSLSSSRSNSHTRLSKPSFNPLSNPQSTTKRSNPLTDATTFHCFFWRFEFEFALGGVSDMRCVKGLLGDERSARGRFSVLLYVQGWDTSVDGGGEE